MSSQLPPPPSNFPNPGPIFPPPPVRQSKTGRNLGIAGGVVGGLVVLGAIGSLMSPTEDEAAAGPSASATAPAASGAPTSADPQAAAPASPEATTPAPEATAQEAPATQDPDLGGPDKPLTITPGKAFSVNDFDYQAGWTLKDEQYLGPSIEGLKLTNNRDRTDNAYVDIKLWRGTEVLTEISCVSSGIAPGTTVTLNCIWGQEYTGKYDKVTINDAF